MLDSMVMQAQDVLEDAAAVADRATDSLEQPVDLVLSKLHDWLEKLISMLPNLVVAVLVMLLFWIASRFVGASIRRVFRRFADNRTLVKLTERVARFAVLTTGLFVALGVLQLDKAVTSLLAGAGVLGLAIGFAFQNIIANFLSGTLISLRKPFVPGDIIEAAGQFGTVQEINLRTTHVLTQQGQLVLIPNKEVYEQTLVNLSATKRRRVDLAIGVSYAEDLETVARVTRDAVDGLERRLQDTETEVVFTEFGDSSINLQVRFWISYQREGDRAHAASDAILAIKKAYDANGIVIPFPIRTLDFGIKGGKTLSEALPKA